MVQYINGIGQIEASIGKWQALSCFVYLGGPKRIWAELYIESYQIPPKLLSDLTSEPAISTAEIQRV